MTTFQIIGRASLLAGLFGGTQAMADVTAQQVWDNWVEQMSVYGEGLTFGGVSTSGDTLTVEMLSMSMSDPDVSVNATMGPITLTEQGDGTVLIDFPDSYPLTLNVEKMPITLTVSLVNDVTVASGTPDAVSYDVTADSYSITLDSLGPEFEAEGTLNAGNITLTDIAATYLVKTDNLRRIDYALNIGNIAIDFDIRENAGDGVVVVNGSMDSLVGAAKIALPLDFDPNANGDAMFVDGFSFEGGYTLGQSSYELDFDVDGETVQGTASTGQIGLEAAIDLDGITYAAQSRDIAIMALVPNELPFPIEASLSEYSLNIEMPLSQSDDLRDFGAGIALRDLAISDGIWNLFDPGGVLPHDPATVAIDLSGKVRLFFDFLDPAQEQAANMSEMPGEIHALDLNDLTVSVAGAEILGSGAFTFDNSDFQTFDGMPRPQGEVNLEINGINGLIDKLIQMGLIPQEEAMAPRMMLGMFATPVGDDQLSSKIEINEQGHILANGQRLQ